MATIQVRNRTAYYHDGGVPWKDGNPGVIFLHGGGMDHSMWQQQSRALAHGGFNVAALDLPGHGRSDDDPAIASVADYAAWVVDFMDAVSVNNGAMESASLVGLSLGSAIALNCAAEFPQRVRSLALVGIGPEMRVSPALLKFTEEAPAKAADFIVAYGYGRSSHLGRASTPGHWMLGSALALINRNPDSLHRDFLVCSQWEGASLAPRVNCPTLIVMGSEDRMTPPRGGKELAEAIPGAHCETMDGAGHMVPIEAPRLFLKRLREFLS